MKKSKNFNKFHRLKHALEMRPTRVIEKNKNKVEQVWKGK